MGKLIQILIESGSLTGAEAEKLEDSIANVCAEYGLGGSVESSLTGNSTAFPIETDHE